MPVKTNPLWKKLHDIGDAYYQKGMDFDKIHKALLEEYNDEPLVYAVVKKIKAEHYAERAKEGKKFLVIGGILMALGFVITCVNFHSDRSFSLAMYGFTSGGLICAFYGLYKFLG